MNIFDRLFPYQRVHLAALSASYDVNSCTIDSSDTGTGKTYTSGALCKLKNRRAFVICPKPVVENWYNTLELFGVEAIGVANYEAIKNGKYYESLGMFRADKRAECPYIDVIKGDETDFDWNLPADTLLIFDEAHKGKNHITINSQLLVSTKKVIGTGPNDVRMLILSATITDKVDCFRVAAHLLGLSQYGKHAFRVWLRQLARLYPGVSEIEAIHRIMYPRYGSRMRIRDIKASEDPTINRLFRENIVRAQTFDMSPEAETEIEAAYNDIATALAQLKAKQITESCYLTILLRARQRIEMLKIPTFILNAMEYLLNEQSVVIFVNFTETITSLFQALDAFVQKEFGSFITFIHGGQSVIERQDQIANFQSDRSRLMIANIKAGGVGVSLHDLQGVFPRVALHFPTWSSIDFKQALGRIYRADAKSDALQIIVYCKGKVSEVGPVDGAKNDTTFGGEDGKKIGVEELIANIVNKKLKTIEWINNGDEEDLTQI